MNAPIERRPSIKFNDQDRRFVTIITEQRGEKAEHSARAQWAAARLIPEFPMARSSNGLVTWRGLVCRVRHSLAARDGMFIRGGRFDHDISIVFDVSSTVGALFVGWADEALWRSASIASVHGSGKFIPPNMLYAYPELLTLDNRLTFA